LGEVCACMLGSQPGWASLLAEPEAGISIYALVAVTRHEDERATSALAGRGWRTSLLDTYIHTHI